MQVRDDTEREKEETARERRVGVGERLEEERKVEEKGICKIKRQGPIRWCWAGKARYRQE